jgi:hypothetical protein
MPFGFGRKKDEQPVSADAAADSPAADRRAPRPIRFHGLTEEWRLSGTMTITGRLLETLNRRESIDLAEVLWAPIDGSTPDEPAPGIKSVDPYDLIVVVAGPETLAAVSEDERSAHRVHKVSFDVALEAPPFRIVGTVQLHPGSEPEGLLDRSSQMFVAVTEARIGIGELEVDMGEDADTALVNRFYLRGVAQVDLTTGERHLRLPGTPLGGTNWRERSR